MIRTSAENILNTSSRFLIGLSCFSVYLMMIHIVIDVIIKYFFGYPVIATFEMTENYYMVSMVFLPIPYVNRTEGHIYVEAFTKRLAPHTRSLLDGLVGILTFIWMLLLTVYSGIEAANATFYGDLREITGGHLYIWPSRWFVPLGCAVMMAAVAGRTVTDLAAARAGCGRHD